MGEMKAIAWNVIGGIVAGFVVLASQYVYRKYWIALRFKKIFGGDVTETFHVVYSLLNEPEPPPELPNWKPVFKKPPRADGRCVGGGINLGRITSCASAKAVAYLVNEFGKNVRSAPSISSDTEVDIKMDLSFISIGGLPNFKTSDLLNNPSNVFLEFGHEEKFMYIKNKNSGEIIVDSREMPKTGCDYGIIIKLHPQNNQERTWACCAGFGIWGTSGAAYYLAYRWKEILKWAGDKPFACVVKTKATSDDSTEIVEAIIRKQSWPSKIIRKIRCRNCHFRITEF